jgi:energy-coupling factor transporter ATP-binding protein EcfA2
VATPALHFQRLQVRRMAGIDASFAVDALSDGINVIYGPNGCGKSRTAAAINALLWPGGKERASLAAQATLDGRDWRIDVDGAAVHYQRDGADASPPPLPPSDARDRYNLPLHDLLHDDSTDFAETILKESAGGYDLKALAAAVGARPGASAPGKEAQLVRQSLAKLREAEDAQHKLLDDEQRLAELEQSLASAESAARQGEALRLALRLRDTADALRDARAAFERFEPNLARLRGDELQSLDRLQKELRQTRADADACRRNLAQCAETLEQLRLPDQALPDALIKTLAARHQRLTDLRTALDTHRRERAAADAERAKARARIAPSVTDEQIARADTAGLGDLDAFARELLDARAQQSAHDALAQWVGRTTAPSNLDQSSYALRLLWRWLQTPAPAPAEGAAPHGSRAPLVVACVLIVLQSLLLAYAWHWAFAAGCAAPLLLLVLARRKPAPAPPAQDARLLTESEFTKLNLPGPASWAEQDVAAAADRLAQELAAARVDEEKFKRWEHLAAQREPLKAKLHRLETRRKFLAAHLGVPPDAEALSLVALASNVARWQDADARAAGAGAKYDAALEQYADELDAAAALVRPHGYSAADVPEVAAALEALRDRQNRFEVASTQHAAVSTRLADAERQAAQARSNLTNFFTALGLADGDEPALRRLCGQRQAYLEAGKRVERATYDFQTADRALPPDSPLREPPRERLESELRDADAVASQFQSLNDEAVAIRTRLAAAKKAADVEDALTRHTENLAALAAKRGDDCAAVAAHALVEYLRRENRDRDRPAVFHRARELFSRVTHGRYRLDFDDSTDPPGFRAADSSTGVGHPIDQLSSGTRLQLLLSVRVAFVEEQEHGVKLPLLLDECLANSDESRARAIIDATLAIARSGRQVFYFTAQLDEVAKWKQILEDSDVPHRLIDLAEARGLAATERLPLREIRPLATPKVPEPVGLSREQYAALLQVPAFDPSRPEVGGTHLWHVIDDPKTLHRFLRLGINTWGQLRTLGSFNSDVLVNGSADAFRRASAAARTLEVLAEAWRVGRGRPVDRQTIEDSGAVSERFLEEVCALLPEVDHDGAKLVAALEAGRVKGFRRESITNLQTHLLEHGHIDLRPPVPPDQIRARMLAAAAPDIAEGRFDPARVDEYLSRCRILGGE